MDMSPAAAHSALKVRVVTPAGEADGRLDQARRLLRHLQQDWPAMDVVLEGASKKGKERAWGERAEGQAELTAVGRLAVPVPTTAVDHSSTPSSKKRRTQPPLLYQYDYRRGIGSCFRVIPQPHQYMASRYTLPDPIKLAKEIPPFPLPPTSSFRPPRPNYRRGKWIVPVHGPILHHPEASSARCFVNAEETDGILLFKKQAQRLHQAEQTTARTSLTPLGQSVRANSQEDLLSITTSRFDTSSMIKSPQRSSAVTPSVVIWTPSLLASFHKALMRLSQVGYVGPTSFILHPSTLPLDDTSVVSSVRVGDHFRIYIDLAYAMNVRYVLDNLDLRLEDKTKEGGSTKRVHPLRGMKLVLVSDEGEVLLVA